MRQTTPPKVSRRDAKMTFGEAEAERRKAKATESLAELH